MCKTVLFVPAVAGLVACLAIAAPAQAQFTKVWVSSFGQDSPPCGPATFPCRSLQRAHDKVAAGGEIGVVGPGDYGLPTDPSLNIAKSVHITNDGAGEASILANGGGGIMVSAGVGDVISLRGLVIDGQINGTVGVTILEASAVHVQNCVIRNFESPSSALGILLISAGNTELLVSDTIIFNNGNGAQTAGINIQPRASGNANVVLDRVHLENNVRGLWVEGDNGFNGSTGAHVIVRDSVVSGNAGDGILATSAPSQAQAFVVVTRTSSVNNGGTGIRASGPRATMLLDDNTVARNGVGLSATNSGQLISYGNNRVNNNIGPDGVPTGSDGPI